MADKRIEPIRAARHKLGRGLSVLGQYLRDQALFISRTYVSSPRELDRRMHLVQKITVVNIVVPVPLFPLRSVKAPSMSKSLPPLNREGTFVRTISTVFYWVSDMAKAAAFATHTQVESGIAALSRFVRARRIHRLCRRSLGHEFDEI